MARARVASSGCLKKLCIDWVYFILQLAKPLTTKGTKYHEGSWLRAVSW